jgi:hypothetical protein
MNIIKASGDTIQTVQDATYRQETMVRHLGQSLEACEEEELLQADNSVPVPRRLPWCATDEDYEAVIAEVDAEACRWS